MISRREQIIRAVMTCCQDAITPIAVLRQPSTAIPREQTPVLILTVVSDTPVNRSNDRMERELAIQLIGLVRDPTDGYAVADDMVCRAHLALLADPSLHGLALAVNEMEVDYQIEDADVDAVAIPAAYRITYRTLVSDISQGG